MAEKKAKKSSLKSKTKTKKRKASLPRKTRAKTAVPTKEQALAVYDLNGKSTETLTLDPLFHEGHVNTDIVYQAVLKYRAGEREGTASTKDRGHVRGGGKKP